MPDVLIKCSVCGAVLDEEDLFCPNCGTEAPSSPSPRGEDRGEGAATDDGRSPSDKGQPTTDKGQPTTDKGQPTTDKGQPITDKGQPATDNRQRTTDKPAATHLATCNFTCRGCGASMSYDASAQTLRCPFCGSEQLEKKPDAKEIAPDGVVPFVVTRDQAEIGRAHV